MKLIKHIKLDVLYRQDPYADDHNHRWYPVIIFGQDVKDHEKAAYMEGSQYKQELRTIDFWEHEGTLFTHDKELVNMVVN